MDQKFPDHPVLGSFSLPDNYQAVWDDINGDFQPQEADAVTIFAGVFDPAIADRSWSMWTIDWLQRFSATSVALYAPQFHLTRATLTLVRWAQRLGWEGKIIPYGWTPGEDPQDLAGFSNQLTMTKMTPLEQKKIVDHNKGGDVADAEAWWQFRP